MTELIDPRPLEPSWVTDLTPGSSGMVEWQTARRLWNKELKKYEKHTEYFEGTPAEFIKYVCSTISSVSIGNAEIIVDASQSIVSSCDSSRWYDINDIPHNFWIDWGISYNLNNYPEDENEVGTDPYELISWVAYVIENNGKCIIDLQDYDPTP